MIAITIAEYALILVFIFFIALIIMNIWCVLALKVWNPILTTLFDSPAPMRTCHNIYNQLERTIQRAGNIDIQWKPLPQIEVHLPSQVDAGFIILVLLIALAVSITLLNELLKRFDTSIADILKYFMGFLVGIFYQKKAKRFIRTKPGAIFISYRRNDCPDTVARIYEKLVDHFGKQTVFRDINSLELASHFPDSLVQAVNNCRVLVAVIGTHWLEMDPKTGMSRLENEMDFVRYEISTVLKKKTPVIPLVIQGAQFPTRDELPACMEHLPDQNGMQIHPDPLFAQDMTWLIESLEERMKKRR